MAMGDDATQKGSAAGDAIKSLVKPLGAVAVVGAVAFGVMKMTSLSEADRVQLVEDAVKTHGVVQNPEVDVDVGGIGEAVLENSLRSSLVSLVNAVDQSLLSGEPAEFQRACSRLANEVFENVGEKADLHRLAGPLAKLCDTRDEVPLDEWGALREKLLAAMKPRPVKVGVKEAAKPPSVAMPDELKASLAAVNDALSTADGPATCAAMEKWSPAFSAWAKQLPEGPKRTKLMTLAEKDVGPMVANCRGKPVEEVAVDWLTLQQRLQAP